MPEYDGSSAATMIGDLWSFDDPAASEMRFAAEAQRTDDQAVRLQLLTQVARAQGLQRRFDEAHRTLDMVEAADRGGEPVVQVRLLLERGRVFNSAREGDRARPLFEQAWSTAQEAAIDDLAVDAAHMLAIVAGDADDALRWNDRAIDLAQRSSDPNARQWLGSLCINLGWAHHDRGAYDAALHAFERALREREAQGDVKKIRIVRWMVARALRSLGRIDESLALQRALKREHTEAGTSDAYVDEEIGECLLALGCGDEAAIHFAAAHAALSQDPWLAEREPQRLQRLARLAAHRDTRSAPQRADED